MSYEKEEDISERQCLELVRQGLTDLFNESDMVFDDVVEVFTFPSSVFDFDAINNNFRKALLHFASSMKSRSNGHIQKMTPYHFSVELLKVFRDAASTANLHKDEIWQDPVFSVNFKVHKKEEVEEGLKHVSYEYKECDDFTYKTFQAIHEGDSRRVIDLLLRT
ncbi:MAG: hypothetical protein AAF182_02175 [Pseudomonadota bacterium]